MREKYIALGKLLVKKNKYKATMVSQTSKVCTALLLVLFYACERTHGACNVTHCTDINTCRLSADSRTCKCAPGYYGDLCDKVATSIVVCGKDYITIMVIEDFFKYYNVKMESLHLGNDTCRAHQETVDGVSYYIVRTSKEEYAHCGGKPLQKNITHVEYALTLVSAPEVEGYILRDPTIRIEYKCVYPYIRRISLPFPIVPLSSEVVMWVNEMEATIEMLLYKDESYSEAFTNSPVLHLRDKVYVELRVTEPEDYFYLAINECWATQSSKPNKTEGSSYTLLLNGCIKDETVQFKNGTELSAVENGSVVRYSFDMFRFVIRPHDVYLHCTVRLCPPEESELCVSECKAVTKREVGSGDQAEGLLTYGPIRLEAPDRPESNVLLMLVLPVGGIWIMGLFLFVLVAIAKGGNKRMARLSGR